ncbi:MAG TPA: iron uptake transporter deferrochelatase/peroxidase subunit, partial [Nitrolancea sp.]|nr:iron uptake transporter deferrochelatase/peroxidase subunit [Nitrolancea sp.]
MLKSWTDAARLMCQGQPAGSVDGSPYLPPSDTGEALGLSAANLTLTIGFGPTFFDRDGQDRFGLGRSRPDALIDLPAFAGDEIDPQRSDGDIIVQACADDAQVTFHAIRNLARIARGVAVIRWSQLGFGRTSSTSRAQQTPRNLMGFKDGTNNIKTEDTELMAQHVWVNASDQPTWMRDGSYMVIRRIRMLIEVWDRSSLGDQQRTFGRDKVEGAPLGQSGEFAPVDLAARDATGAPLIPTNAHIRLASHSSLNGVRILRRGYSFTDGMDVRTGQLDTGLFFICFQRNPATQFVTIQRNLAHDGLNEYIQHTASGVYAIPPGVQSGEYWGQSLLES